MIIIIVHDMTTGAKHASFCFPRSDKKSRETRNNSPQNILFFRIAVSVKVPGRR